MAVTYTEMTTWFTCMHIHLCLQHCFHTPPATVISSQELLGRVVRRSERGCWMTQVNIFWMLSKPLLRYWFFFFFSKMKPLKLILITLIVEEDKIDELFPVHVIFFQSSHVVFPLQTEEMYGKAAGVPRGCQHLQQWGTNSCEFHHAVAMVLKRAVTRMTIAALVDYCSCLLF